MVSLIFLLNHLSLCLLFLLFFLKFLSFSLCFQIHQELSRHLFIVIEENQLCGKYILKVKTSYTLKPKMDFLFAWLITRCTVLLLCITSIILRGERPEVCGTMESGLRKKMGFLNANFWILERSSQLIFSFRSYDYFTTWNTCIYIIFWNIIYSLQRNELYHSLRRLVYVFEFWMFCFVFLSFLLLSARKTCALLRGGHGTDTGRPATGGLLESQRASKQHRGKSSLLFLQMVEEAHHPDLFIFSILYNISMQETDLHNHTLYSIDI